jgi:hypothetical protein
MVLQRQEAPLPLCLLPYDIDTAIAGVQRSYTVAGAAYYDIKP